MQIDLEIIEIITLLNNLSRCCHQHYRDTGTIFGLLLQY